MNFIILEEVDSTNSYVSLHASELPSPTMVIANTQTSGRGQRGNSWESEPGLNLTATLFYKPLALAPRLQFALSEAVALAVADYLRSEGLEAMVKWPNDIYVGNSKICGILIEHCITSTAVEHSRIGIGLNVNQTVFVSDAPNPVSMRMLTGQKRDISRVAAAMGVMLEKRLADVSSAAGRERLHNDFLSRLWRGDGKAYPFRRRSDGGCFQGVIETVEPSGPILISDLDSSSTSSYMFKEVEFII